MRRGDSRPRTQKDEGDLTGPEEGSGCRTVWRGTEGLPDDVGPERGPTEENG